MNERPLGTFSDELDRAIDRALTHLDARLDATDRRVERQFADQGERIDGLTAQVTKTNGSVRELQGWRQYMEGLKAGAGGSWHLLIGGTGIVCGAGGLVVALLTLAQHAVK